MERSSAAVFQTVRGGMSRIDGVCGGLSPQAPSENNGKYENCRILAIRLGRGILNVNHWEKLYHMDFANRCMDTE